MSVRFSTSAQNMRSSEIRRLMRLAADPNIISFAGGMLLNEWGWQRVAYTLYFPLALWLVVGYFAVARFLGYLDLRIRREGWEVELVMRAEQARLTREMT